MFKTIMWASDGTENADRSLPYAKVLAREEEGTTLVVAHEEGLATEVALAAEA